MEQRNYLWDEKRIDLRDMLVEPFKKLKKTLKISVLLATVLAVFGFFTRSDPGLQSFLAYQAQNGLLAGILYVLVILVVSFVFCFLLCVVFVSLFWCVAYVLSNKVKTAGELQEGTGLLLLGDIQLRKQEKKEQFARRLLYGKQSYSLNKESEVLYNRILGICQKQGIREITFGGEVLEKGTGYMKKLVELLAQKGVSVRLCESFSRNARGIAVTAEKQEMANLILLVAVEHTTYEKIADELRFCQWQDAKLMGYVAICE